VQFGLRAFGSALGAPVAVADAAGEYTDDVERVLEHGYRNIHRAAAEQGLVDLAAEAGEAALREAGVEAGELDLLVLAITDIPEYLYWDPAGALQARLRADRAEAVLIAQGCVGGITCLDTVAGRFATHREYRRALVVGANRTCEAYWNRMETHTLLFSDGAAAAVAVRDHPRLRWRASEVISDGRYADFFRMDTGGAAQPFEAGNKPGTVRDAWDVMEYFNYDPDRFGAFIDLINDRVRDVVVRACDRVGVHVADLARVVLLNDNLRTISTIAARLGVPVERTNLEFSLERGHFGAADHLLNLQHHVASGHFRDGDLVALAAMGRGMHWACTIIEG
jgi:3-oxoacyl-[acyl-carrier-protein] synthase-3